VSLKVATAEASSDRPKFGGPPEKRFRRDESPRTAKKPFDRSKTPYEKSAKPYDRSKKPFARSDGPAKPFDKFKKPFTKGKPKKR